MDEEAVTLNVGGVGGLAFCGGGGGEVGGCVVLAFGGVSRLKEWVRTGEEKG